MCGRGRNRGGGNFSDDRGGTAKHPPGLKGKQIGLFYAHRSKEGANRRDKDQRPVIQLSQNQEKHLTDVITKMDAKFKHTEADFNRDCTQLDLSSTNDEEVPGDDEYKVFDQELLHDFDDDDIWIGNRKPLVQDNAMDTVLKKQWKESMASPKYQRMFSLRKQLPVFAEKGRILKALADNQVCIVSGETGSGKSTQVAQFVLDEMLELNRASSAYIVVTEPRRISAITLAERVAAERAEPLGKSVGYQIRHEARRPRDNGGILYCTNGILLRWMTSNPDLHNVSHVVLDEIHERDLFSDFLLILIKDLLPKRPNLKVVLMSATINAQLFAEYFTMNQSQIIQVPGRLFNVEPYFLEDVIQQTHYRPPTPGRPPNRRRFGRNAYRNSAEHDQSFDDYLTQLSQSAKLDRNAYQVLRNWDEENIDLDLIVHLTSYLCDNSTQEEAILIFVPGWNNIRDLIKKFEEQQKFKNSQSFLILPLHSLLPSFDQKKVFDKPDDGCRKIIIATNIAETSITIEDVVYVIDCGKNKMTNYDVETDVATLQPEWNSLSNVEQRRGRAGRVREGKCFHLFTKWRHDQMDRFHKPEMLRIRLESLCLQVKLMKLGLIAHFLNKAPNPPSPEALQRSLDELIALGALEAKTENLTPLGWHLARLPIDPHCAKMVIYSTLFACVDPILTIAACLDFKNMFFQPMGKEKEVDAAKSYLSNGGTSDHLLWSQTLSQYQWILVNEGSYACRNWAYDYFISEPTVRMIQKTKKQLADILVKAGFLSHNDFTLPSVNCYSERPEIVSAVICAGLYPRVAHSLAGTGRRPAKLTTKHWRKVELHPKTVCKSATHFNTRYICFHKAVKSTGLFLHDCTMVSPLSLVLFSGDLSLIQEEEDKVLILDKWIKFYCDDRTVVLLKKIRYEFGDFLARRVDEPFPVDLNKVDLESEFLTSVSNMLLEEKISFKY